LSAHPKEAVLEKPGSVAFAQQKRGKRKKKEQRKDERVQRGGDTTARRLPPRWRCVRSPGSATNFPPPSSASMARGMGGLPPPTPPSSGAGSPRHHLPLPPPRRVGRRARDGLWGTCSALRSPWSAPRTPPSRYIVASARLPATAAPPNDARFGLALIFDLVRSSYSMCRCALPIVRILGLGAPFHHWPALIALCSLQHSISITGRV